MALTATSAAGEPRSWSDGPMKKQIMDLTVLNGDTSGTITCDRLSQVDWCIVTGLDQTAAPTMSGNVITLAFADPLATRYGQLIAFGK